MLIADDSVRRRGDLVRDARGVAATLEERGIAPGDRVALKATNSGGFVVVLFALVHLGASIVLLDHDQPARESQLLAERTRVRLVVVDDHAQPVPGPPVVSILELLHGTAERSGVSAAALDTERWRALDDALILFSSGSTAGPKCVVKPGRGTLDNVARTVERMRYGPADVLMPLLPFSHQYGVSLLLSVLESACGLTVTPPHRLDRALWTAARTRASVIDAAPAMYHSVLGLLEKRPSLTAYLDHVRMFCVGGAPLTPDLSRRFEEMLGRPLLDGYGSTELGNVSFATPDAPRLCGPLLPGVEAAVLDEDGRELPAGAVGTLSVRTPDAFVGYLAPDDDPDAPPVHVPAPWWDTGDLACLDATGTLQVLGRRAAVHRMGHTLYPEVLERRVAECGAPVWVAATPDERIGNRLVYIVEDPAGRPAEHWRPRIEAVLAPFEYPNRVLVIDSAPLGRTGKADRAWLTALADASTDVGASTGTNS